MKFRQGDKVYFSTLTDKVLTISSDEGGIKGYPVVVHGYIFTEDGRRSPQFINPCLFQVTEENHELLERLYRMKFERPSHRLTPIEKIKSGWYVVKSIFRGNK